MKRHRWMAFVPYEVTVEDGLRMIGELATPPGPPGAQQATQDRPPAPEDTRPFLGTHNIVNELVAVGCFDCEQPLTKANATAPCPGEPTDGAEQMLGGNVKLGFDGVGRNDPCPC